MARPRRSSSSSTPRSVRTARDNARARALGYASYYDYRLHGSGRIPASTPAPAKGSAERAAARGHRGIRDLERSLRPGDVIILPDGLSSIGKDRRDNYTRVRVLVVKDDGREQRFTISRAKYERMVKLLERASAAGAIFSPSPSLDLRRLVRVGDRPELDEEDDEE